MTEVRVCRECGEGKPLEEYYRTKRGYILKCCKACVRARSLQTYYADPVSWGIRTKRWQAGRKAELAAYDAQWRIDNPEKLKRYKEARNKKARKYPKSEREGWSYCRVCKDEHPLSEFYTWNRSRCKASILAEKKEWYKQQKELPHRE